MDILLKAYLTEFSQNDDVTLVIKGLAQNTYYESNSIKDLLGINKLSKLRQAEIIFIENNLKTEELSSLYSSCNVYVHPYRAEGFGMPIFEAMACGIVPIVTNYGASLEYCNNDNSFLISYEYNVNKEENTFIEPNINDLKEKMRYVYENQWLLQHKAKNCINDVQKLSWDNIFLQVDKRLKYLKDLPEYRNNKSFYIDYLKSQMNNLEHNSDILKEIKTLSNDLSYKEILANEFFIKEDYKKSLDTYLEVFNLTKDKKFLPIIINLLEILKDYKTANTLKKHS